MKRRLYFLAAILSVLAFPGSLAWGTLSNYTFTATTGSAVSMSSATSIWTGSRGGRFSGRVSSTINIGFSFMFDGTSYTQVTVSSSGVIGMGSTAVTSTTANNLTGASVPIIAPFWDALMVTGGCGGRYSPKISYLTSGSAGNRVFVVDFQNVEFTSYYENLGSFQVRMYEADNSIEFYYGSMDPCGSCWGGGCQSTSATIGLAVSSSNYLSVTPTSTSAATVSSSSVNNSVNVSNTSTRPATGTVYRFRACGLTIVGNTAQGGTTGMTTGDSLLTGKVINRGNPTPFQPFTISNIFSGCTPPVYSYAITGPNAGDYQITPTNGTLAVGASSSPILTFTPSGLGKRNATLTITDSYGFNRSYPLAGIGTTRIEWNGNLQQGGTTTMTDGDTLMRYIKLDRHTTGNYTPISIRNFSTNPAAPPAPITFTIDDPTGQYSVSPSSAAILAGVTVSPIITFNPTGVGPQPAKLTVTADGEVRVYILYAFSAAPGARFSIGSQQLGSTTGVFINQIACVGEAAYTQAVTVTNVGVRDFEIRDIKFYLTDTTYRQGTPPYPLLRDQNNNPVRSYDYFITTQPGVAPLSANQLPAMPIVVPEGQTRTIYLTFIGQTPGKRFARAYIQTNGENLLGKDLNGNLDEGMLNFDLFGQSVSAYLSDNPNGGLPKAVAFPETAVGDSVDVTVSIFNTGICDLRISKSYLKLFSGDINEFKIVSAFPGTPTTGSDYILGPAMTGTLTLRFLPSRSGTRRATVWLRTNDSTILIPGVTNRGDYFLDLFGPGRAGLDVPDVTFAPAIIDGESSIAEAMVVNSSTELLGIAQIRVIGPDAAEFAENPAKRWPSPLPKAVQPGEELKLSVVHTATSGSAPGPRQAKLEITLTNGRVIIVELTGAAWTRTASASLSKPFTQTTIGALQRRMIRIENTGWAPLVLQMPTLTGLDASEFAIGNLPRMILDSGQVEFLEVTYAPTRAGTATATVNIMSNATNGAQTVTLSGSAKTARDDEGVDDGSITIGRESEDGDVAETGTSGVQLETRGEGMVLRQSVPNPANGSVRISYALTEGGTVSLVLYNERGEVVKTLAHGEQQKGEHTVAVDVSGLSSGVYHYRLDVNGRMVSRTLRVAH